jgi:hypothetical protein
VVEVERERGWRILEDGAAFSFQGSDIKSEKFDTIPPYK